ncbi:dethiobiotin synthase [Helicobacter marmotae]|uniref:ATP-dependent dethiobiotin synthetase BioD n=1 Tax=Helicobacter marmotae TaxID=152490 RepID=A0A3D8I3F0_9HELI|nr:ATP-dependent dethiobiotin synthetase BioD [Helicobacter marmotae]RDU59639.1 ATP-dependent dethiobiotin synthetase BioD [Helicobacter marmotae]
MKIYICGIHTDTGKTHFSAAFCAAFGYDYFKLIQAGSPKDSDFIATFSPKTHIFKEGVFLHTPASPHVGKKLEGLDFKALQITLPQSENMLIETAGGLFTPIDEGHTMIDYISAFTHPCIVVGKYYLGCINHILLSLAALKSRDIPILALALMGEKDEAIDEFIRAYAEVEIIHCGFYTQHNFKQEVQNLVLQMPHLTTLC